MNEIKSIQLTPTQLQVLTTLHSRVQSTEQELRRDNEHFSTAIILILDVCGFDDNVSNYNISIQNDKLQLIPKTQ